MTLEEKRSAILWEYSKRVYSDEDYNQFCLDFISAVIGVPTERLKELVKSNESVLEQYDKEIGVIDGALERARKRVEIEYYDGNAFADCLLADPCAKKRLEHERGKAIIAIDILKRLIELSEV